MEKQKPTTADSLRSASRDISFAPLSTTAGSLSPTALASQPEAKGSWGLFFIQMKSPKRRKVVLATYHTTHSKCKSFKIW